LFRLGQTERIGRRNLLIRQTKDNISYWLRKKRGGRLEAVRNLTSFRAATAMPFLMIKNLPRYECLLAAAKEFPDLDPWACAVYLHLLRAGDEVFKVAERNLNRHAISPGRFGVLMLLGGGAHARDPDSDGADDPGLAPGPHTPAELADAAGVTRATMTGLVDTLERDGLVRRVPDKEDRRMMSVVLTPKARQFLSDMLPGHFRLMAALASTLSESERQTLVALLNKIIERAVANPGNDEVGADVLPESLPTHRILPAESVKRSKARYQTIHHTTHAQA
jgi:DNA-binding MarR family transcriptional regulator